MSYKRKEKGKKKVKAGKFLIKRYIRKGEGRKAKKRQKIYKLKIKDLFNKKVASSTIRNFLDTNIKDINKYYKSIIKKLLKKEYKKDEIIKELIKEENIQKIKDRIELKMSIYNREGNVFAGLNKDGGTLMELKKRAWVLRRGFYIEYDLFLNNEKNWIVNYYKKDNVDSIQVKIIIRT